MLYLNPPRAWQPRRIPAGDAAFDWLRRCEVAYTATRKRPRPEARAVLTALLSDLAVAHLHSAEGIFVCLNKSQLPKEHRRLPDIVRRLVSDGIVQKVTGKRATAFSKARQTVLTLSPEWCPEGYCLAAAFDVTKRPPSAPVLIRHRRAASPIGPAGERVPTATARAWLAENPHLVAEMHEVNAFLLDVNATHLTADTEARTVTRIFRGSLRELGRMYHAWWIDLPKEERGGMLIDDEPAALCDFGQMGIHAAYYLAEKEPPQGDMYELGLLDVPRETVKLVMNAMLSHGKELKRFPKDARKLIPNRRISAADVIDAVKRKHSAIAHYFAKGYSGLLARVESDIAIRVLLRLKREGGPAALRKR